MIKLSVIIPVYNVEQYIEKCILSIEDQDIPKEEYEIIAVNDGTLDNSVALIQQLQTIYTNIKLVHKVNGGLSSARNYGMKFAQGNYIWFIDSDDYIEKNIFGLLLQKAYTEDLDVLCFNNNDIYIETGRVSQKSRLIPNTSISGLEYLRDYDIAIVAWSHIAKRELYIKNNIQFTEGIFHEDYEFILAMFEYCNRMNCLDIYIYNYLVKESGTITTSKNESHIIKRLNSWIIIISNLKRKYPLNNDPSTYSYHAYRWTNVYKFHALSTLLFLPLNYRNKCYFFYKFKEIGCFPLGPTYKLSLRRQLVSLIYNSPFLYKKAMRTICLYQKIKG